MCGGGITTCVHIVLLFWLECLNESSSHGDLLAQIITTTRTSVVWTILKDFLPERLSCHGSRYRYYKDNFKHSQRSNTGRESK